LFVVQVIVAPEDVMEEAVTSEITGSVGSPGVGLITSTVGAEGAC
jgi:hypothetical protein